MAMYKKAYISSITWVEAQVIALAGLEEGKRQAIDASFEHLVLDDRTLLEGLELRRNIRIKLPDALIFARARVNGWLLVSCNTKDFSESML
jgi:predicted nucleic acid-binding protein